MTSIVNKSRLEFYKNKMPDNEDNSIKYKNLPRKYLYTYTIEPKVDFKKNTIMYEIPFAFFTTKNMSYIHNIQVINNKEYLDWSLIYGQHLIDHIPNSLLKIMQEHYNISNQNILPFDISVNNYLPVNPKWKYFLGGLQINAELNNKELNLESLDLDDLSLTIDLFTLETNESLEQEHIKKLEEDIKDLKHDMMFKGRINHSDYKYRSKGQLGLYNFNYTFIAKIDSMIWHTVNKTNEIKLYSQTKNTTHIIINANANKLSSIKLYLNKNPILDLKIENIRDDIYLLHLKDENDNLEVNLYCIENVVVTFITENTTDLKKIKYYSISQGVLS